MNYLAHLFLAQPHADSYFGNLLGDFRRGVSVGHYPDTVLAGLQNHYLVDRFTDQHPEVKAAKPLFSAQRRRFAGIALDILFDHFLIRHWHRYSNQHLDAFCQQAYLRLNARLPTMPSRMQRVVGSMIEHQWLQSYGDLDGVAEALDRVAGRIRFANQFAGSIEDILTHHDELEQRFVAFFPHLQAHVHRHSPERGNEQHS